MKNRSFGGPLQTLSRGLAVNLNVEASLTCQIKTCTQKVEVSNTISFMSHARDSNIRRPSVTIFAVLPYINYIMIIITNCM